MQNGQSYKSVIQGYTLRWERAFFEGCGNVLILPVGKAEDEYLVHAPAASSDRYCCGEVDIGCQTSQRTGGKMDFGFGAWLSERSLKLPF